MKTFVTETRTPASVILVLCLAASAAALDFPTPEEVFNVPGDRIIARVGGIPITTVTLIRRSYPSFIRLMQTRAMGIKAGKWGEKNERSFIETWDFTCRQTLAGVIHDELLYTLARKANLIAFPSLVEKRTEEKLSQLGGESALKELGFTIEDLKKEVEKGLLIETVLQTYRPPATPAGPAEARSFYEKHLEGFTFKGPGYRLRIISMPKKTSAGEDNRPAIEAVLEEINAGEDFARLAVRRSIHPSRNYGGLLLNVLSNGFRTDILAERDIPVVFRENLSTLKEGQVCKPVMAEGYYYLILLEKRFSPGAIPFEELVNKIISHLTLLEEEAATQRWLIRLAEQAGVTDAAGKSILLGEIFNAESPKVRF